MPVTCTHLGGVDRKTTTERLKAIRETGVQLTPPLHPPYITPTLAARSLRMSASSRHARADRASCISSTFWIKKLSNLNKKTSKYKHKIRGGRQTNSNSQFIDGGYNGYKFTNTSGFKIIKPVYWELNAIKRQTIMFKNHVHQMHSRTV